MSVMASGVLSILVWVLCVSLLPTIWADNCRGHGVTAEFEELQCGSQYCCGDGDRIYCCDEWEKRLTPYEEGRVERLSRRVIIMPIVTGLIATLIFIAIVTIIICAVCPCCFMYKKCRTVIVTSGVNAPQMPLTPYGQQPSHPGYQPVPLQHYSAMPTAPPSYMEATDPAHFPVVMYPIPPPGQNYLPPPQSDEFVQHPYNPSYGPNP
ncbi:hypothetical protein INR49_029813 [Caranx melampygus]|nr:hypothetical protein INR49_029813 [Caranx melampygus]